MEVIDTALPEVKIIEAPLYRDDRGWFTEVWHDEKFTALGLDVVFRQDNHSCSARGTLRGLHYQVVRPQGKLVRCSAGSIFDVAVDIRRSSERFGRWVGVTLSPENNRQLWVPPGFAHGFVALEDGTHVQYKCTEIYIPEYDRALAWDDPAIGIAWPTDLGHFRISAKDKKAPTLERGEVFE